MNSNFSKETNTKVVREYLSVIEASKQIASDIIQYGVSKGWSGNNDIALDLEKKLSQFNIGFDVKTKGWIYKTGGTKYFKTLKLMHALKSKVNSLINK